MNDYELVIKRSKTLERILEEEFKANGRGLHEKVTSIQEKLPLALVKKLRFIATLRNKLIHDDSVEKIEDKAGFVKACDQAEKELNHLLAKPQNEKNHIGCFIVAFIVMAILIFYFF